MPHPDFWLTWLVIGAAVWIACSYQLTRWPIWGWDGFAILVVWPPYLLVLGWCVWQRLWGKVKNDAF